MKLKLTLTQALACTAVASALLAEPASAVLIGLNNTQARLQVGGDDTYAGTTIPASQTLNISNPSEGTFSEIVLDYSELGDVTTFSNDISQRRNGGVNDFTQALNSGLFFAPEANATYELSGFFGVSDLGISESGTVVLEATLTDTTSGMVLFSSIQQSTSTHDQSFSLGGSAGDTSNLFIGSLTGTLDPTHVYRWDWSALSQAAPDMDGGAEAEGFMNLVIDESAVSSGVPDGGQTLMLLGLSLFGLAYAKRKMS